MQHINDSLDFTLKLTEPNIKVTIRLKSNDNPLIGRIVGFRVYPKDHVTTWEFVNEQYYSQYLQAASMENKKLYCAKIKLDDVADLSYELQN